MKDEELPIKTKAKHKFIRDQTEEHKTQYTSTLELRFEHKKGSLRIDYKRLKMKEEELSINTKVKDKTIRHRTEHKTVLVNSWTLRMEDKKRRDRIAYKR